MDGNHAKAGAETTPNHKSGRGLLILAVLSSFGWLLNRLMIGGWVTNNVCISLPLFVALLPLFIVLIVISIVRLIRDDFRSLADLLPVAIILLSLIAGLTLPLKSAAVFRKHRTEFLALADSVGDVEFEQSVELPSAPFYDRGTAYYWPPNETVVVEFIISDFYLPLVYIASDAPEDVYDTCSAGGSPVARLEPHWYVCRRDWN